MLSPAQISYITRFVLGFVGGGLLAAFTQFQTTGVLDWHSLAIAFSFGAAGFLEKWISVQFGADSVPIPKLPPPTITPPH